MKIDIVNQNRQVGLTAHNNNVQSHKHAQSRAYLGASPAFTGATAKGFESMSKIKERFLALFPENITKRLNFINKFEPLRGEKGGIITTAVGTGLVAPFPIAFNPLVKAKPGATEEEKEELSKTKKYSAWRQPVSAAVAIALQVPILKVIDRILDNWHNNPEYSKNLWILSDRSALNTDSYKKDQYKDCYLGRQIDKELKSKSLEDLLKEAAKEKFDGENLDVIDGEKKADTIKRLINHKSRFLM